MDKQTRTALIVIGSIVLFLFLLWVFKYLWNTVVVQVFPGVNRVTFLQGVGLLIVASFLFTPVVVCGQACKSDE